MAAGNEEDIESLIKSEVFSKVIRILYRDDKEVKIEALWVLANAAGKGRQKQVDYLVRAGILPALIHCLSIKDPKILQVVLLAIKEVLNAGNCYATESGLNPYAVIFEESEGVGALEQLQNHQNYKIAEQVYKLIVKYFDGKPEDQDLIDLILTS